jgi:hypothetical protein
MDNDCSLWQLAAARKFKMSAAAGCIRGDGMYCCVSRCTKRWRVLMFPTIEARDARYAAWFENGCGSVCESNHFTYNLDLAQ